MTLTHTELSQLLASIALAAIATVSSNASAQQASAPEPSGGTKMDRPSTTAADMADGEVRKVDKDAKKITLKHGPIKNLDMPGMTMVFQVRDPAMLDAVQAGDKVRFSVERAGGAMLITRIAPVR